MQPSASMPAEQGADRIGSNPVQSRDWMRIAREAFEGSTFYFDSSVRRDIEQDIRQFQSVHPAGSKYLSDAFKARSTFFRPKTRSTIRKGEAKAAEAFFSTNDVISVKAENEDDIEEVISAAVQQELVQYRLTKTVKWFETVIGAYQEAMAVGVVISYQDWEFDRRRGRDGPIIELRPTECVRIDPAANWTDPINTSPYVIDQLAMYVKDVRAKANDPKDPWAVVPDSELLTAVRGYADSTRLTREGPRRVDSKDQRTALTDYTIVWVHRNIVEVDGRDWLYYTLGTTVLLSEPRPLEMRYLHGRRPYVMGVVQLEAHRLYPSGVSRLTRQMQGEINENANQRSDNVKFAMNKRYFVKRGKRVDLRSLIRNVPSSVTLMDDPEADVKVQETQDVTSSAYMEQDRLNLDFDEVSGSFSNSSVQSNRQLNETVGGMNLLTASANVTENYQLRTFVETWALPVLRQVVLLEQFYETDDVILGIAADRAQVYQKLGVNAIVDELLMRELTLDVNIGMNATSPEQQINRLLTGLRSLREVLQDGVLERYGLNVSEVIKEIFGKLGYRDGKRFFNPGGDDPRVTYLQNQIADLQDQLERKVPRELLAAQIDEIHSRMVKTGIDAAYAAVQAAGVIAGAPQVAPVADTILRAMGYRPPVPAGEDPDLGVGAMPMTASAPAAPMEVPGMPGSTHPDQPAPAPMPPDPGMGERQGIETERTDGVPA